MCVTYTHIRTHTYAHNFHALVQQEITGYLCEKHRRCHYDEVMVTHMKEPTAATRKLQAMLTMCRVTKQSSPRAKPLPGLWRAGQWGTGTPAPHTTWELQSLTHQHRGTYGCSQCSLGGPAADGSPVLPPAPCRGSRRAGGVERAPFCLSLLFMFLVLSGFSVIPSSSRPSAMTEPPSHPTHRHHGPQCHNQHSR